MRDCMVRESTAGNNHFTAENGIFFNHNNRGILVLLTSADSGHHSRHARTNNTNSHILQYSTELSVSPLLYDDSA